jgi:hypothetical protein
MSKAASAFSSRPGFVNRNRLRIDSAALFASADVASQAFLCTLIPIQRISEQKQSLGCIFESSFESLWRPRKCGAREAAA